MLERRSQASDLILWSKNIGKRRDGEDIAATNLRLINDHWSLFGQANCSKRVLGNLASAK